MSPRDTSGFEARQEAFRKRQATRQEAFRKRQATKKTVTPTAAVAPRGKSRRQALDAYYTPDACALACVRALGIEAGSRVVEPSVGGGAWVRALRATVPGVHVHGIDIDPKVAGLQACDTSSVGDWRTSPVPAHDWIVGNPPYREAEEHIRRALSGQAQGVAFLLRLGLLASRTRQDLWAAHPPTLVLVLPERPSFLGTGSDSTEYALFVWHRDAPARPIAWLSWPRPQDVEIGAAWGGR